MGKIDISNLIGSIENSFIDNGIFFEVESVSPEEVLDEVRFNDTFKRLSQCPNLIEEHQWVKIAYGQIFAFAGIKADEEQLDIFVDVAEDCPIDDLEQMIVDGIRSM